MLDEIAVRKNKLAALIEQGIDPYPPTCERDALCSQALEKFDDWSAAGKTITLAGRLLVTRVHGGMIFADLADHSAKFQLAFRLDDLGEKNFAVLRDLIDPGDIIQATGKLFATKRGEKTLEVAKWKLLAKALRPLPEKWHGLQDVEQRYRQRELDLLSNPEVKQKFIFRAKLISDLRRFLDDRGFLELDTPVLHPIPGGANAKPFITHHNALDADFYLRIAPELYLKRALVGGFEKIYEIARCFRNEGIDFAHNPEFTQLELYWAYADKDAFFYFMEEMMTLLVGGQLDVLPPWPRKTFAQVVMETAGIDLKKANTPKAIEKAAQKAKLSIDFSQCHGLGEYYDELYKRTARPAIKDPTWVTDYPVEMKPLARRHPDDPTKSATAQLIINGLEVINAYYHELNDPTDQRERFMEQEALKEQGSEEAQRLDEPFLRAMEHGLPPACGLGLGIDRLVALLTDSHNIKEVILFPTLRPES